MRSFHKILLGSAAALSLTTAVSIAQDNESTNVLGNTLDSVTGTVSGTVDGVTNSVSGTVEGVTNSVDSTLGTSVGDTVTSVTGGDATGTVGDVTGAGDVAGSTGDVGNLDFNGILSNISSDGNSVGDIGNISDAADLGDVQVIDIADVANFDANALNDALNGNASNITALQDALNGNSFLNEFFSANSIDVSDVVALNNDQDGSLTFYTYSQED
ncbi:hypothetical protein [Devosia rhizoryzae]|uniref:Uncharacterized protein n=1 Tax=Devosia rhizoryzae TaxID=2774137 RepID=A0ABX7CDW5_9HYPH|nr:hypothetical protein [Devosia rhizoryzae]QQR40136.1 hypothetical protein JI748_03745 [Devosia rhizoryzae]